MTIEVPAPDDFNFAHSLDYLRRSPKEILHRVEGERVSKAMVIGGKPLVLQVWSGDGHLQVEIVNGSVAEQGRKDIVEYITEWFDLRTDIRPFYKMAAKDDLLKPLAKKYKGYRIVGQPDLFESLVWAVLGQQINLGFAYSLKERFVSTFGQRHDWEGTPHYIFPEPSVVSEIRPEQLLALQFSRQKAAYTIGIAKAFHEGDISKSALTGLPLQEAKERLMKIHGVGNWTANYALMKTFRYPDAFPLEDAGLHNAIKQQMNLKSKPDVVGVKKIFKKYRGWEAYATLYLWKSLGGE